MISPATRAAPAAGWPSGPRDDESREWLRRLHAQGATRADAIAELHALLLRATRFEVARRRPSLPHLRGNDLDDIANQAADDALVSVLRRLDDFRGLSRFTTWVYKFAVLEAAVKLRTRSWQGHEVPLEMDTWNQLLDRTSDPSTHLRHSELLAALQRCVADGLTPHQRQVLVALALNDVPIDVLAARLGTTRGALHKVLHDARRKLRRDLDDAGLPLSALLDER